MMRSAIDLAAGVPWLITEDGLRQVMAIAARESLDPELAAAIREARASSPDAVATRTGDRLAGTRRVTMRDGVAIIPVIGPIFRYANLFAELSGATSTQVLATDFQAAIDSADVKAIALQMDTPGGHAAGIAELADAIRTGAASKPVVTYVGDMAASAGYWLASATEIVLSRTAMVGSIGARMAITDRSMADAQKGVRTIDIVSSGAPKKGLDPASVDGQAEIRALLDALEQEFVAAVALGRGVSVDAVRADFGQGGIVTPPAEAVRRGMADRIGTFESIIRDLAAIGSKRTTGKAVAAAPSDGATMTEKTNAAPLSAADLIAQHPEAAETIRTEAFAKGEAAGRAAAPEAPTITAELVARDHPAIAEAFRTEGRDAATAAERDRLLKIDALALPGHADLVTKAKAEGMSAADFAVAQTEAEKRKGKRVLDAMKRDEEAVDVPAAPTSGVDPVRSSEDDDLPIDKRAKAEWDKSADLRSEFGGNFDAYLAFRKAEATGSVRVHRRADA